jgi:predicted KAP-like P-loop ATPase
MDSDSKNSKELAHRFSADRPIASREEDLLGRAGFADSLASAIKRWKGKESLVIALYGPWGSGKSSIKNMVLQTLRAVEAETPLIVPFNPWQWAGQDRLVKAFFGEIELVLGVGKDKADKKRAAEWKRYAATWKAGSFVSGGFYKLVLWLVRIVAGTGLAGGFAEGPWLKGGLVTIGLIALVLLALEKFYGFIGTLSEKIASVFEARANANSKSLAEQKDKLSALLQELKTPILVVIDDVDRLSADEIRLLFQLVKANADFPNVVYLLLFQRDIVERSLDSPGIKGQEFLEKIVQVGFDIPRIGQTRLEKVLFAGLDELLTDERISERFDRKHWGNLFLGGLRPYFQTLRHVYRHLATLSFHVSLFRSAGSFEVNPVDLIALEVLRIFEPCVYQRIPEAKEELTRQRDSAQESHDENERIRHLVEGIIEGASQKGPVREIVKQLFPTVEWVFGGIWHGHGPMEELFRDLRVCHPKVFDRYFHFTIPKGDISQAQLDRILSLAGDREDLVTEFRALNKQGLLGVALDRLEAYKERIDIGHAIPFITALFDIGDELPEERGELFSISPETHASRIVYWYLRQEKDVGKRGKILKEAMRASTGLYLPNRIVSLESGEKEREKTPDEFNVADADVSELQQLCVEKINHAAGSGKLATHPKMAAILYRWRDWDSLEKPRQWVERLIESREGVLSFLVACLQRSSTHGMGDYVSEEHWEINLASIEKFVPVDILEEKVEALPLDGLDDKEKKAVDAFKKAVKRRRQGKPDDAQWDDEE